VPEGDTIHRTATTLRRVLGGRILTTCESDSAAILEWQLVGRRVARVEARGKHLLIHCDAVPDAVLDPGRLAVTIHSHMGMTGSWHVYRSGEAWKRSRGQARLVLGTHDWVAPCFAPERLEPLGPRGLLRHPMLRELGPDLLDPEVDLDEALARLLQLGELEVGDAILRQSAVAGLGNVYKSELLFLERIDPFARVATLAPERLLALLERARELLRINVESRGDVITVESAGGRRTRFEGRGGTWVYERSGRVCRECGTVIRMRRQGPLARSTYYCSRCQGP
jgi:endonuclease-8